MMAPAVRRLVDQAYREIADRDAAYFEHFPIALPADADDGAAEAMRYLARAYCIDVRRGAAADPVSRCMLDAIADAHLAAAGALELALEPRQGLRACDLAAHGYEERTTRHGRRFYVRDAAGPSVLLVSALGIPLAIWSRFILDAGHGLRLILPEMRCGELLEGGMRTPDGLGEHVADLLEVIAADGAAPAFVAGWCNGGRIAIRLARELADAVDGLVLLSVTLRGADTPAAPPSAFEENLARIFLAVSANPGLAAGFVKILKRSSAAVDWSALGDDPEKRAAMLFAMPAKDFAALLQVPMSRPEYLVNYARRTSLDEAFPVMQDLKALGARVLVITGTHDHVVSNAQVLAALNECPSEVLHASIGGAGHYVQDLQYPYFRWLLEHFVRRDEPRAVPRRVRIERHKALS